MATHGTLSEFVESQENWTTYVERLEQYFTANDIADDKKEKKRAILLSACGATTYQLVRNLLSPNKPAETDYKDVVAALTAHYNPNPSQITERFKFNSRIRRQGENIATFVADLRRLTEHCGYGSTLDEMIRDRFVCGINDARIQRRLLSEPALTLQKAIELAQTMEAAERDALELQKTRTPNAPVHSVAQSSQTPQPLRQSHKKLSPCYRCGGPIGLTPVVSRMTNVTHVARWDTLRKCAGATTIGLPYLHVPHENRVNCTELMQSPKGRTRMSQRTNFITSTVSDQSQSE